MDQRRLEHFASRVRGVSRTGELDSAAAEAIAAFEAAGIEPLLLKGAALARLLYTAEQQRGYSDVDLLVAPNQLASAGATLAALGYTNTTAARGVEDVAGAVHADTWVRRNEEIGPLMIDLHARLPGVNAAPGVAWELLTSRRVPIDLGGREAWVLPREGLALQLATHAAQHGPDDPRPLSELRYGLEHWPEPVWEAAAGLARDLEAVGAFAAGLRLLVPEGTRMATTLELPPAEDIEWEIHHRGDRPRGTFHLQALLEARGLRERAGVLRRSLLPKREWIVWEDPRAARGGLSLARARIRHILRVPLWALRALLYRRRRTRRAD